jgi:hypothetical protein
MDDKLMQSKRRVKLLAMVSAVLVAFLAISVAATGGVTFTLLEMTKESAVGAEHAPFAADASDASALLLSTTGTAVISTGAAMFRVNASELGSLPDELLYSIDKCYLTRERYISRLHDADLWFQFRQQLTFDRMMRFNSSDDAVTTVALLSATQGLITYVHFMHELNQFTFSVYDALRNETVVGGTDVNSRDQVAEAMALTDQNIQTGRQLDEHGRALEWSWQLGIDTACGVLGAALGGAQAVGVAMTPGLNVAAGVASMACGGWAIARVSGVVRRRQLPAIDYALPPPPDAPDSRRLSAQEVEEELAHHSMSFASALWCTGAYHNN